MSVTCSHGIQKSFTNAENYSVGTRNHKSMYRRLLNSNDLATKVNLLLYIQKSIEAVTDLGRIFLVTEMIRKICHI